MSIERPDEARLMQPSVLAFMGDAVFNLFIRERLIMKKGTSHKLHVLATEYVKAASQSKISKALLDTFTEDEAYIFKREGTRNPLLYPRTPTYKITGMLPDLRHY